MTGLPTLALLPSQYQEIKMQPLPRQTPQRPWICVDLLLYYTNGEYLPLGSKSAIVSGPARHQLLHVVRTEKMDEVTDSLAYS